MKTVKTLAATVLVIVAAMADPVSAQDQPQQQDFSNGWMTGPHGMMGAPGSWMMGRGGFSRAMCNATADHIEGRLAYAKAELKTTEAQEALWNAYAAAARDNATAMRAHCTTMMSQRSGSAVSLPDRLDQHEQLMAAQLETVRAMDKALKPLYAALSDAQKHAADYFFWSPYGHDVTV